MLMFALFLMFLSIILPFGLILYARLIRPHRLSKKASICACLIIVLLLAAISLAMPISLYTARDPQLYLSYHVETWLPWLYFLMTFICLLLMLVILRDIGWSLSSLYAWIRSKKAPESAPQTAVKTAKSNAQAQAGDAVTAGDHARSGNEAPDAESPTVSPGKQAEENDAALLSRREFLKRASTAATIGGTVALTPAAVMYATKGRKIRHFDLYHARLPQSLDGLRIAHLSDIHVGNTIGREDIEEIVAQTNALEADLIVITGDMVDGLPEYIGSWLDPMKDFKSRYGTYFVTGNHDHLWNARAWCDLISGLGIHVLDNAHELIEINGTPLAVAGAIDAIGDRKNRKWKSDPEKALANIPPEIFRIMLVHQPRSVDRSFAAGADLVLLGHTHGGQCWPLNLLISAMHKYSSGLYEVDQKLAFVSCGTGYWGPPLRIGVPAEIDLLTLHPKA